MLTRPINSHFALWYNSATIIGQVAHTSPHRHAISLQFGASWAYHSNAIRWHFRDALHSKVVVETFHYRAELAEQSTNVDPSEKREKAKGVWGEISVER